MNDAFGWPMATTEVDADSGGGFLPLFPFFVFIFFFVLLNLLKMIYWGWKVLIWRKKWD